MSELWRTFLALGDPNRLEMVRRLAARGPLSMGVLSKGMPFTRQAGAKHVGVLEAAGIITLTKRGREQIIELERENLRLSQMFMKQIGEEWDERLHRLRDLVE